MSDDDPTPQHPKAPRFRAQPFTDGKEAMRTYYTIKAARAFDRAVNAGADVYLTFSRAYVDGCPRVPKGEAAKVDPLDLELVFDPFEDGSTDAVRFRFNLREAWDYDTDMWDVSCLDWRPIADALEQLAAEIRARQGPPPPTFGDLPVGARFEWYFNERDWEAIQGLPTTVAEKIGRDHYRYVGAPHITGTAPATEFVVLIAALVHDRDDGGSAA